jgi:hypothetical protein
MEPLIKKRFAVPLYAPLTGPVRACFPYARSGSGGVLGPAFPQESLKGRKILKKL